MLKIIATPKNNRHEKVGCKTYEFTTEKSEINIDVFYVGGRIDIISIGIKPQGRPKVYNGFSSAKFAFDSKLIKLAIKCVWLMEEKGYITFEEYHGYYNRNGTSAPNPKVIILPSTGTVIKTGATAIKLKSEGDVAIVLKGIKWEGTYLGCYEGSTYMPMNPVGKPDRPTPFYYFKR